jgi:hypothetical protein
MKKTIADKTSLESTISTYRRKILAIKRDEFIELEIRFENVKYMEFTAIKDFLLSGSNKNIDLDNKKITNMVTVIKETKKNIYSFMRRDIKFNTLLDKSSTYMNKEALIVPPFRVINSSGLNYKVSLTSEKILSDPILMSENSIVKVKSRLSIPIKLISSENSDLQLLWTIDITIVREISSNEAKKTLKHITNNMFKENTIEHFLSLLTSINLSEMLYKYEIEIEFIGVLSKDSNVVDTTPALLNIIRPADVIAAADIILNIKNPEYKNISQYQEEIYKIAQYIIHQPAKLVEFAQTGTLKRLLPQVIAITKNGYMSMYPPKNLFITDKADGKRCIAVVRNFSGILMTDKITKFAPMVPITDFECELDTILDGELISINGVDSFFAFDIIALTGINISIEVFDKRLGYLEDGIKILNKVFGDTFAQVKSIHLIEGDDPEYLESIITQAYNMPKPYQKDGLIFIENEKPYELTTSYKWKSTQDNTIDFLVKRCPRELLGKHPFIEKRDHKIYFLFVGINIYEMDNLSLKTCEYYTQIFGKNINENPTYIPIQFSPPDVPYAYIYQHPIASSDIIDGKIVEFRCKGDCTAAGGGSLFVDWEIVKIRDDRTPDAHYYGNHIFTAEDIWLNYINPFSINELWEKDHEQYFKTIKGKQYDAMVKVINFVKGERIQALSHATWVLDIGAGKGQDLGRYFNAGVRNLIALDQDRSALTTLIERRKQFIKQKKHKGSHKRNMTSVYIILSDINHEDSLSIVDKCNRLGMGMCDAIVCNLAFHYFLGTSESISNFMTIAEKTVAENGLICITCFCGESIHNLFKKLKVATGEKWDLYEHDILKYSIERRYSSNNLEYCGQKIGVLLPFSMGKYYEEYLVNINAITKEFKKRGFNRESFDTLDKIFARFEAKDHRTYSLLTENDKEFLSLYCEMIFRRVK